MHLWGIHISKFDEYTCPYCIRDPIPEDYTKALESQFEAHGLHKKLVLEGRAGVIVADYCQFHELDEFKVNIPLLGTTDRLKLSCLGFVLLSKDAEKEDHICATNFDCFSLSRQKGAFFSEGVDEILSAFNESFDYNWEFVFFWADGGMRTLANLNSLAHFQQLIMDGAAERELESYPLLQANFYPPYHGHHRCDAHFGRIKQSAAEPLPNTVTLQIPPVSYSKPKLEMKQLPLLPQHPPPPKSSIAFTYYYCFLFDPDNPRSVLLYPYSDTPLHTEPIRCAITLDQQPPAPIIVQPDQSKLPWIRAKAL